MSVKQTHRQKGSENQHGFLIIWLMFRKKIFVSRFKDKVDQFITRNRSVKLRQSEKFAQREELDEQDKFWKPRNLNTSIVYPNYITKYNCNWCQVWGTNQPRCRCLCCLQRYYRDNWLNLLYPKTTVVCTNY